MATNLAGFLKISKEKAKNLVTNDKCHVMIGNEAADLDSIVSAISLAYLRQRISAQQSINSRPVAMDDLDLHSLHSSNQLTLALCDHNVLTHNMKGMCDVVTEIVDHHKNELLYNPFKRNVQMVGSCASLVVGMYINEMPSLLSEDPLLPQLLYYTILLDTIGLDWTKGRVTQYDVDMIEMLQSYVGNVDKVSAFNEINKAKFDMSQMTADQLLRKDYKGIANPIGVGISSIGLSLATYASKETTTTASETNNYMQEKNIEVLVIMSVFTDSDESFRREVALCSHNIPLVKKLANGLLGEMSLKLTPQVDLKLGADLYT
eukprot:Ihof_evm3s463 gene=Ihof_evmTU3s463